MTTGEARRHNVRIGCGSPDAESRLGPAIDLALKADLDYIALDTLSERTLPVAQLRRRENPELGYDARARVMFTDLLNACVSNGVRMVGNMGGANPDGAFRLAMESARECRHRGLRLAVITGDDVLGQIRALNPILVDTGAPFSALEGEVVSANAYIGAESIASALDRGASVVIGGRIADPSLYLGPLMFEFGWGKDDWEHLAAGQVVGHLLECGTHATGGNMADPPYRTIPGLSHLGLPYGEVDASGEWTMTKLPATGGLVDVLNCKAQLFHEIHDPQRYLTPDVTVDVRDVVFKQLAKDSVRVSGARGSERPALLKVLVGVMEGYIGEGEMTFAGPGALSRSELAAEVIRQRMQEDSAVFSETRFDLIGVNSVFGSAAPPPAAEPNEVRLRVAVRSKDKEGAEWINQEIQGLFFGPASGGGMRRSVREVLAMHTTFLPREAVAVDVHVEDVT